MTVRTRFAPSPTGYIHVGGIRTALFAWLVAKHSKGQFILRLEDTDKNREVEGAKDHIIKSLKILGLDYDEGPDKEGPYGPYVQSERLDIYKKWADVLIQKGRAYRDPVSHEELNELRQADQKAQKPFLFRNHRPDNLNNEDQSRPLRFKSEPKDCTWHDEVMGDLSFSSESVDDFILIKSDGYPTYNFAHIVDDLEMKISHVIRGQEFISSVPNYLNLYEALNEEPPIFATMPHILGEEGNKKLSKRDGAKDVLDYINEGYLPDALISFIATLGWNDGTTQEIFTKNELIEKFDLSKVQRSGAKFDETRLKWINGSLIRQTDLNKLYDLCAWYWPEEAKDADKDYKLKVLGLIQERLKYLSELNELSKFFFTDLPIDESLISSNNKLKSIPKEELGSLLEASLSKLEASDFSVNELTDKLNQLLEETNQKPAILFSLIRIATTQARGSPPLAETIAVLGKETVIERLNAQIDALA